MREDLDEKVAVTLARFDKAVRQANPIRQKHEQRHKDGALDLAELIIDIAAEASGGTLPADKPSCRPWDYEAFTSRLATFTPLNWFSKPAFASPMVCARYGWTNTGRDTLCCQCCGAQLHFFEQNSGSDGNGNVHAAGDIINVVEPVSSSSFTSRLKSQHHDLCPWNGNACPKEFLLLPAMAVEDVLTEFLGRLDSLLPVIAATALPEVSLPSSFEQHCPGGLSALASKTRALLAQQTQRSSRPPDAADAISEAAAVVIAGVDSVDVRQRQRIGGDKRLRDRDAEGSDGSGDAAGSPDDRKMLAYGDEVVGTAAAIAMFGWRSATSAVDAEGVGVSTTVVSPTEGSSSGGTARADADGGARTTPQAPLRLICIFCKRRLVTDNFLTLDIGDRSSAGFSSADVAVEPSSHAGSSPESRFGGGEGGSRRSGKRRRLSGGGTPLKPMDLSVEHRSFCPWAAVHPPVEDVLGEETTEGDDDDDNAVPGWRQPLEALLSWADAAKQQKQVSSKPKEVEGFGDAASRKAGEAFQKVQKVLGMLMRY